MIQHEEVSADPRLEPEEAAELRRADPVHQPDDDGEVVDVVEDEDRVRQRGGLSGQEEVVVEGREQPRRRCPASRRMRPSSSVATSRSSAVASYQPSVAATRTSTRYGGRSRARGTPPAREPIRRIRHIELGFNMLYGQARLRPVLGMERAPPHRSGPRSGGRKPVRPVSGRTWRQEGSMKGRTGVRWLAAVAAVAVLATVAGMSTASGAQWASRSHRRGRPVHRGVGSLRPGVRGGRSRRPAGEDLAPTGGDHQRQDRDRVRRRRHDTGGWRERRADDDLQGRRLHSARSRREARSRSRRPRPCPRVSRRSGRTTRRRPSPTSRTTATSSAPCPRTRCRRRSLRADQGGDGSREDHLARRAQRRLRHRPPSDPQDGARAGRDEDPGAVALRPDRRELQLRGRRHRQGQPWPVILDPGELREDRLGAPAPAGSTGEALRRRRLAGHDPVVHPDCVARGARSTVAGSPTGTKAASRSTGSSRPGPGRRTARRWTRTTSTER